MRLEGKYKIKMLQRSLLGCWQLFCLYWVAVIPICVKIHKAINKYPKKKILILGWLPFIMSFYVPGTMQGTSHIFLSTNRNVLFPFHYRRIRFSGKASHLTKDHIAINSRGKIRCQAHQIVKPDILGRQDQHVRAGEDLTIFSYNR